MLDKRHWVVFFAGTHCLDTGAEARNGQNNDIADLLGSLHASEVFPGDVALARAHIEELGVVEVAEDGVGPDSRAGELNDALGVVTELASLLAVQSLLRDVGDNVDENRVTGLRLDGPLAELDAAGVPVSPVWAVRVSLNANDHAVRAGSHVLRDPVGGALEGGGVDV